MKRGKSYGYDIIGPRADKKKNLVLRDVLAQPGQPEQEAPEQRASSCGALKMVINLEDWEHGSAKSYP